MKLKIFILEKLKNIAVTNSSKILGLCKEAFFFSAWLNENIKERWPVSLYATLLESRPVNDKKHC